MNTIFAPSHVYPGMALVIPAYEPSTGLLTLVQQLVEYSFAAIVVIDDGSGPPSKAIFDQVEVEEGVTLLRHRANRGKGAALKSAFQHISDDSEKKVSNIITLDADGQHCVEDIVAIAQRCRDEGDKLIMGVRAFSDDVPLRSRFGNLLTRRVLCWINQVDLQDTQTGLRCLPLAFAEQTLAIEADRYEFELECILLAKQMGISIVQHQIQTIYIDDNISSHFRPIVDSLRIYHVFGRYLMVSIGSFLLDISLFTLFYFFSGYIVASTYLARLLSGYFNFYLNKHSVFHSHDKQRYLGESIGYIVLAVFIATLSGIAVNKLVPLTNWHATPVKIVVDTNLFVLSFLVQKFIVFRNRANK